MTRDDSPTARALLLLELIQNSPGITANRPLCPTAPSILRAARPDCDSALGNKGPERETHTPLCSTRPGAESGPASSQCRRATPRWHCWTITDSPDSGRRRGRPRHPQGSRRTPQSGLHHENRARILGWLSRGPRRRNSSVMTKRSSFTDRWADTLSVVGPQSGVGTG